MRIFAGLLALALFLCYVAWKNERQEVRENDKQDGWLAVPVDRYGRYIADRPCYEVREYEGLVAGVNNEGHRFKATWIGDKGLLWAEVEGHFAIYQTANGDWNSLYWSTLREQGMCIQLFPGIELSAAR
ncbi:MAG: hypothetical protein HY983_01545 [Candidatus Magasanikbacteria bacterium]|nr:hypothetical protein [Candidatus Magasanikbacteria bacterium]